MPYIDRAVAAGIPVATFNSETATANKRLFFVGADLYLQGQTAGKNMVKVLGGKGKVAVITGFFSVEAHELRRKGFEDEVAKEAPGDHHRWTRGEQGQGGHRLQPGPGLHDGQPGPRRHLRHGGRPLRQRQRQFRTREKPGKVKIISYDFVDETMQFVKAGVITGTLGQDPFAQGHDPAVRLYNYLIGGVVPPAGRLLTKADFVTKDNISQFYKSSQRIPRAAGAGGPFRELERGKDAIQRNGPHAPGAGSCEELRRGLRALDGVSLEVRRGEVHAVVGENGAGKSTLMKILGGIISRDAGRTDLEGREVSFSSPREAIAAGIAVIHQELSVLPTLNVVENLFMGRMPTRRGRVQWKLLEEKSRAALAEVGLDIDPRSLMSDLPISQRQLVEIAKALSIKARLDHHG